MVSSTIWGLVSFFCVVLYYHLSSAVIRFIMKVFYSFDELLNVLLWAINWPIIFLMYVTVFAMIGTTAYNGLAQECVYRKLTVPAFMVGLASSAIVIFTLCKLIDYNADLPVYFMFSMQRPWAWLFWGSSCIGLFIGASCMDEPPKEDLPEPLKRH